MTALILAKINIFSHLFHVLYLALLVSAAGEYAGKLVTGQGFVTKYVGRPKKYADVFKTNVLPALGDVSDAVETQFHKVVFAQDIEATLKAAGASYILFKLTSWFSLYSLFFALVILAFTGPFVYSQNLKEIDAAVAQYTKLAKAKIAEITDLLHKKAAPHVETLAQKTGPVGQFVKSKFPTRTAGSTVHSKGAYSESVTEPSTGVSSGASTFPTAPSSAPHGASEFVDEVKTQATEAPHPSF